MKRLSPIALTLAFAFSLSAAGTAGAQLEIGRAHV